MNTIGGPLIEGIGGAIGGIVWNIITGGGGSLVGGGSAAFMTQILEFIKNIIKPIIGEPIRVISGV